MGLPPKKRPPYADPVREMQARCTEMSRATMQRRSELFNATFSSVGAMLSTFRGGTLASQHPHRCRCQDHSGEKEPHKHYPDTLECARGCGCRAYIPAVEEADAPAEVR